jgi:alcohol dehydrogenase (cytochrome c)
MVWKMDPGTQKPDRNRGVALWGNYVISVTGLDGRVIATDKETGKVVWDKNLLDQPGLEITAAPLALKDAIVIGASGGDNGVRDWIASLDPRNGDVQWKTFVIPAHGEPGSETWKDKNSAWRTGGGAMYVTGSYDPATNLTYWGTGNPVPRYDSGSRPGDNLYTDSMIAFGAGTSSSRRTTSTITTPADRRSSSTARSMARTASSWCMPTATASTTPSIASTASSSRRCNMPRR